MATRTDLHRPSQLVPSDYQIITTFALPRGGGSADNDDEWFDEGYGNEEVEAELAAHPDVPVWGECSHCGSCGARFGSGALFRHRPSGDYLFVGHDCADAMFLIADWSGVEVAAKRSADNRKLAVQRRLNAERKAAFLLAHVGLAEALTADHRIVRDIAEKFKQWDLSEAQVALVFKLAEQVATQRAEEPYTAAPTGRVTFTGRIVSLKYQEAYCYGGAGSYKATIKVVTPSGIWLAWGTLPAASSAEKGDEVTLMATVTPSEDKEYFAFYKRPKLVMPPPPPPRCPVCGGSYPADNMTGPCSAECNEAWK